MICKRKIEWIIFILNAVFFVIGGSAFAENNPPLSFQVNYFYRSAGAGEIKPINDGEVLRSGDHYKIIFKPDVDCYVYIFQVDSSNKIFQLFPMESFKGMKVGKINPVVHGKRYILPSPDKAFLLDETVGQERIYFIASKERQTEVERLYANLQRTFRSKTSPSNNELRLSKKLSESDQLETAQEKLKRYFAKRGMNVVSHPEPANISWERDGDIFSVIGQRLENFCKGCVHILEFHHQ
jgi:hypothetical protein